MAETAPVPIRSLPGIKRDGSKFDGDQYVDGEWVRFDRGLPRKMGGYRAINRYLTGQPHTLHTFTKDELIYLHAGSAHRIERMTIDRTFNTSLISDRTPATLVDDDANLWDFDVDTSTLGLPVLLAQVAPNLATPANSLGGQYFTGDLFATTPLVEVVPPDPPTGGVMALHPYTVLFGKNGLVQWSVPGDPTDFVGSGAGSAAITAQNLVDGIPMRGGGASAPSALLWSLNVLMRMTFIGGTEAFAFDTITTQTSFLSPKSMIEVDGTFYWVGIDRFLMFNGVVRESKNELNQNFFFDNLNWDQRQKVYAYKVPRFGEIWWCFPRIGSEECNHAVIFNVRENTWYDTPLPNGGRSAGLFPDVVRFPLMMGTEPQGYIVTSAAPNNAGTGYIVGDLLTVVGGVKSVAAELIVTTVGGAGEILTVTVNNFGAYVTPPSNPVEVTGGTGVDATFDVDFEAPRKLWVHEIGVDEVDGSATRPVRSFFETADISLPPKGDNRATRVLLMEPDLIQTGDLTVQVRGRANARAPEVDGEMMTFPDTATTPDEQVVFFKDQRRELRFRFMSNTVGGDYQMGLTLAHVGPGDGTVLG